MKYKPSAKIESCPFCGGTGEIRHCVNGYIVTCIRCKSNSGAYDTREKAIEAWNTRNNQ